MACKALVLFAEGSEEIETITCVDVLRRGDVVVVLASVEDSSSILCSRNVKIVPDIYLSAIKDFCNRKSVFNVLVLPGGGKGAKTFQNDKKVQQVIKTFADNQKLISAICAAPTAIKPILKGKAMTCYPSFKDEFKESKYSNENVVLDGNVITSKGPATSMDFALAILEQLKGVEVKTKVYNGLYGII